MEDDYLLGDDDELEEEGYYQGNEDDSEDEEENDDSIEQEEEEKPKKKTDVEKESGGRITSTESWLISAYDDIVAANKNSRETAIEDALTTIALACPKNTSVYTAGNMVKEMLHKQGHSRMVNSIYVPDSPLTGEDVDIDFVLEDDSGFNKMFAQEARDHIARFIGYLASRDLSRDSVVSRRRKQRHIPALIIYLFSSGMYDLILKCPTMPRVYAKQIDNALSKIIKSKYDIVEDLAKRYDELGRHKVAERVRKLQLAWFTKEPAEIRTSSEYKDLDLTYDDVLVYREYRSKFTNTSKAITQDVISDLIEVVIDEDAGIYEKLKDKTRGEAIADVKEVYKKWSADNAMDTDLSKKIIWNEINN